MGDQGKGRIAYWDNAKAFLILTVVYGHLIESTMRGSPQLSASFLIIYSFHMPLFVFIAGLMSRDDRSSGQIKKNLATLAAPYFIFETWYGVWDYWTLSKPKLVFSYATPFWPLWFLFSLFCWRTLLPYVNALKGGFWWLLFFSVGLCASAEAYGFGWSLARTVYFFPFFYAGHLARGLDLPRLMSKPWVRGLSLLVFLGLCALPLLEVYSIRREWFFGTVNTWGLGYKSHWDALRRLGVYALSFVMGGCILGLTPRRKLPVLTGWGERSLAIYLFHSTFHFLALGKHWYRHLPKDPAQKGALVLGVSLLLCLILGSKTWSKLMSWCLTPRVDWLLRGSKEKA